MESNGRPRATRGRTPSTASGRRPTSACTARPNPQTVRTRGIYPAPAGFAGHERRTDPRGRRLPLRRHPYRPARLHRRRRPPLAAPVWFVVEDGALVFNTGATTAKGRALARDPRVALVVDIAEPPYAFVQVQGVAETSEDPGELVRTATALGARYMGADRAEEYGRRNAVPGELVVRLRPTKVVANLAVAD
ncbi:PPOX class F420-dependent oxidoreductase [Pseudonocardia sulfidoxydans]|uniref:PPOX class F420-dependent oxidoreductase n=1 Tax=Pseudonocardia sulfidoxydans TaxID=54011 RepID=UPI0036094967